MSNQNEVFKILNRLYIIKHIDKFFKIAIVLFSLILLIVFKVFNLEDKEVEKYVADINATEINSLKFKDIIYSYAEQVVDTNELTLNKNYSYYSYGELYKVHLCYEVNNLNYTKEQYENIVQNEITKLYNVLSSKKIKFITLATVDNELANSYTIVFDVKKGNEYLCMKEFKYDLESGFTNSFNTT